MAGEMKHERIWLEPFEIGDEHPDGRLWCQDNVWGDEADEYVLASSVDSIQSEIAALEAENTRLRETLCKIAKAETIVFDDDLQTDVIVSADEDEMASWAREVLDMFPAGDRQDFSDAVALIEKAYPDHNWHIAKGRLSADEPLYGALILEGETEIAGGESDISAAAAMKSAIVIARAALQTGGPGNV